jgi:hypothetical protein
MKQNQSFKLTGREFPEGTGAALLSTALFSYRLPVEVSAKESVGNSKTSTKAVVQYTSAKIISQALFSATTLPILHRQVITQALIREYSQIKIKTNPYLPSPCSI